MLIFSAVSRADLISNLSKEVQWSSVLVQVLTGIANREATVTTARVEECMEVVG
jgi:hypothetical protein